MKIRGAVLEEIGRQDGPSRLQLHLRLDPMQTAHTEGVVEVRRVVAQVLEIVLEPGLADKFVDQPHDPFRGLGEQVVVDDQHRVERTEQQVRMARLGTQQVKFPAHRDQGFAKLLSPDPVCCGVHDAWVR